MNEEIFWGVPQDEEDNNDMGRNIFKEESYDTFVEDHLLPYQILPLFITNEWYNYGNKQPVVIQVGGIMRSGNVSGAVIKCTIKITDLEHTSDDDFNATNDQIMDDSFLPLT